MGEHGQQAQQGIPSPAAAKPWRPTLLAQFKRDVWDDPTIRPVAAILLSALAALVVWLTLIYSDPVPAKTAAPGCAPCAGEGDKKIDDFWGYVAIGGMAVLTLIAGFEPMITRWWQRRSWDNQRRAFANTHRHVQEFLRLIWNLLTALIKLPSLVWSFMDYVLARMLAAIGGAVAPGVVRRYAIFFAVMIVLSVLACLLPPAAGQYVLLLALLCVVGIVRRWTWVENDRDTFLLERGERDESISREPSDRDLTDEAELSGFCFLGLVAFIVGDHYAPLVSNIFPIAPYLAGVLALVCLAILLLALARLIALGGDAFKKRLMQWLDPGASAFRIKFKEDLRDEAMIALAALFVIIPLGLDIVSRIPDAAGHLPFTIPESFQTASPLERYVKWLGYFGVELAKTVPFVDWSEAFHVANGSQIEPFSRTGSQIAFVLRAGLDLLFLAAVVQAVGIAGRLREQRAAFKAERLPILEPFSETAVFIRAGEDMHEVLDLLATDHHCIREFPNYDAGALKGLIENKDHKLDKLPTKEGDGERETNQKRTVQKVAAALLALRHPGEATDTFFFERAAKESDQKLRGWIECVASDMPPARDGRRDSDRVKLHKLLSDPIESAPVRAAAARRLGRMPSDDESNRLLLACLADTRSEHAGLCGDAAVALSKLAPQDAVVRAAVRAIVPRLRKIVSAETRASNGEDLLELRMPAMATAYALARLGAATPEIAELFDGPLQPHALNAARLQATPMSREAALVKTVGEDAVQMIRMAPGQDDFPSSFVMGFDFRSESEGDRQDQSPARKVTMAAPFAIGRFPVTYAEYAAFELAQDIAPSHKPEKADFPVINVNWHDANRFAAWLSRITGERYRLPNEAEWEYACRAGTTTRYHWGDAWDPASAPTELSSVLTGKPNAWGLWNLYGHVYEWCIDPWHADLTHRPLTGEAWLKQPDPVKNLIRRVVRGGSWSFPPPSRRDKGELRSSYRNEIVPSHRQTNFGFRLARDLAP